LKFHKQTIKNLDQYALKVKDYLEIDSEASTGELMTWKDKVEIVTVNAGRSCQNI